MVQRVNFIEKGAFALTYRNMLIGCGAMVIACLIFHSFFVIRFWMVQNKLKQTERAVQELSIRKEKAMAVMQASQGEQAASRDVQTLVALFAKMPAWSSALSDLADKIPPQLWLEGVKTENQTERSDVRRVEIVGKGISMTAVANFVKALEDSKWFENVVLMSSNKEEGSARFAFIINAQLELPVGLR